MHVLLLRSIYIYVYICSSNISTLYPSPISCHYVVYALSYTPLLPCCSPLFSSLLFLFLQALYPPLLLAYPFLPFFLSSFLSSSIYNVYYVFCVFGRTLNKLCLSGFAPSSYTSSLINIMFLRINNIVLFEQMSNMLSNWMEGNKYSCVF